MTTATLDMEQKTAIDVGLKSRALRVTLHIHAWTNRKAAREAKAVVTKAFGIQKEDRTNTTKALIDPQQIKPVTDALRAIYDDHMRRTLPWEDGGARVLSSSGYMDYQTAQRWLQAKLEVEVCKLIGEWDRLVAKSMQDLGGLAQATDYPTAEELQERYSVDRDMDYITNATDVRFQVSEEEVQRIQQHIEERHARKMEAVMADIEGRIRAVAERAHKSLQDYKPAELGKRAESDFRDSLVTNVRELVDLLPSLNITNSEKINRLRLDLMQISRYDAKELKGNPQLRQRTTDAAKAILAKMGDFIA